MVGKFGLLLLLRWQNNSVSGRTDIREDAYSASVSGTSR